ncbi:hypothetical protein D3C76_1653000 [compost metagenome]
MSRSQWQVHFSLAAAKGDHTDLDLGTQTAFAGKAGDHVLEPLIQGLDLAIDRHTAADVRQHDDRQWASGLDLEFFQF